ncbi:uncharacterized protein [Choristoneura fumiferana]|uniref:uncharacterized protein n=1 Tax=Choristoneura fumiferana TaxID=7141 RepID=UPI003D1585BC
MDVSFESTQRQEAAHTSVNIDCCFPDKLNSKQCYERSSNGRERVEQELRTSRSRLPRIVKTNPRSNGNQYYKPTENRINDSGDVQPGPSRLQPCPGCDGEKFKPSQIPLRRSYVKEAPVKPSVIPKKFMTKPPFKTQARNVQRIQVLNTLQDFCTEKRPITTSLATSRPIPTLGQIYRRTEDTNRVTDWLLERDNSYLHAPVNAIVAEQDHISEISTAGDATHVEGNTDIIITENSAEKPRSEHRGPPQSITNNWMSIHEYPTRDNESGYCSMSLGPQVPKYMDSKHANVIPIVKQSEKKHYLAISEKRSSAQSISSNDGNSTGMLLSEQQTVLLAEKPQRSDETLLAVKVSRHKTETVSQNSQPAFTKGMQFPSDGTFAKSYVDCPSEVFQKTTDFETAGYTSSSSIAGTDLEYRAYSSRGTLENVDGNSMAGDDTHQWSSTGTKSLNSFCCDIGEDQVDLMHQTDELSTRCNAGLISTETYRHYSNCCMLRRERCKRLHGRSFIGKHSNYKERLITTSSNKFKERRPSDMPRKRLSFRRMCQRRWNAVCQKTAERFANRPKSSMKIMKIRMMYAHPELFLEDVNVQTTSAMCTDTGMGTVNHENRSAGIATSLKWASPHVHFMDAATSGTIPAHKKPLPRYIDLGPSIFPWQFSSCSKRKFATQQNNETLSDMPKKRRQNKTNNRPNECINTESVKSLKSPNKLVKDESSLAIIIKDSTPSASKEIQAELSSPLHQVESKTTIVISRQFNIKNIKEDEDTVPRRNEFKKSTFSFINNSGVIKSDTDHKSSDGGVYRTSENTEIKNESASYQNIILTGAGTKDFLHGKNEELIKSLQYSDLIYLEQEQPYTNNMIACNPAEVNVSFCAPSKCCQTGTSCRMHYLCDRSTSVETQPFIRPAVKTSKGVVTIQNNPKKVSVGLSGN